MAQAPKAEVELTAKNSVDKGLKETENSLKSFASRASNLISGAYAYIAAKGIGEFFKAAVGEAANAERNLASLNVALRNTGADAGIAAPQVESLVKSLGASTGLDKSEITAAMNTLILKTGSYKTAMEALPTVLNVARGANKSLEEASTLVSRALEGNAGSVTKLGIAVQQGETPFDALRRTFRGIAEADGKGLNGILGTIKNSYNDLLESLGKGISGNQAFASGANLIVDALKGVAQWIESNKDGIGAFVGALTNLIATVVEITGDVIRFAGEVQNAGNAVVDWGTALVTGTTSADQFGNALTEPKRKLFDFRTELNDMSISLLRLKGIWEEFVLVLSNPVEAVRSVFGKASAEFERQRGLIKADIGKQINAIENPKLFADLDAAKRGAGVTPSTTKPTSLGNDSATQKALADKQFKDEVDADKAKLDIADLRDAAMQDLNDKAAKYLDIAHDTTKSEQERIDAARRYGQVHDVIHAEEKKQLDAAVTKQTLLLELDDKRGGAITELNKLRDAELVIAHDLTKTEQDRTEALVEAKKIEDTIFAAKKKAFDDTLALDVEGLNNAATRKEALYQTQQLMKQSVEDAKDRTLSEKNRLEALQRIKDIEKVTYDAQVAAYNAGGKKGPAPIENKTKSAAAGAAIFDDRQHTQLQTLRAEMDAQLKIARDTTSSVEDRVAALQRVVQIEKELGDTASSAKQFQSVWLDAFHNIADGATVFDTLKGAMVSSLEVIAQGGNVFQGFTKAMKKGVAEEASAKGKFLIGEGIGKIAQGGWPPNPLALAAGAKEVAAGGLLVALSGQLGGGGGAGASGGGGASPGSLNASAKAASESKPDATIIIKGGLLNMNDPAQADQLGNAINTLSGRRVILMSS